jgi:hypothetical protein
MFVLQVKTENYANQVREFVLPFLEKCEEREKGARYRLLEQYLTSVSSSSLENSLQVRHDYIQFRRRVFLHSSLFGLSMFLSCIAAYRCSCGQSLEQSIQS